MDATGQVVFPTLASESATAPVAMPTDGKPYTWNEDSKSWDEITLPTA